MSVSGGADGPAGRLWQPTPFEAGLGDIVSTLVDAFGWTLAKLD